MRPERSAGARRVAALARLNLLLLVRDPGRLIGYTVLPLILMTLFQPLYRLALGSDGAAAVQAAAGMVVMFSLFALNAIGHNILDERSWRTWDRLRATEAGALEMLAGKALPFLLVLVLQQTVLLGLAVVLIGLRPAGPVWLVVLAGLSWALCVLACGAALATFARSHGQLGTVVDIGAMTVSCLGGAVIPPVVLPSWLQSVTWLSPGRWAMDAFRAALTGAAAERVAVPCAVLLAIALGATSVAAWGVRRGRTRSRHL